MSSTTIPLCVPFRAVSPKLKSLAFVDIFHPSAQEPFLSLCACEYPIAGGHLSGIQGIPVTLIIDACQILTGLYKPQYSFKLYRRSDNTYINDHMLLPEEYDLHVEDEAGKPFKYRFYKNFHTWRPPTRNEVPSHWFTKQSPQMFTARHCLRLGNHLMADQPDMQDFLSNLMKHDDGYHCAVTRVVSPSSVEGALGVPLEELAFYAERNITNQLCPRGPLPRKLQGNQLIYDIQNHFTLDIQANMSHISSDPQIATLLHITA
ncbi:hypothetical protein BDP27DRAFT_1421146 [Rhodocollybia butyracea]|uniref:Uncharacterized protein n=1 Tax=Rhodocollybia butyracea TaxID=206335 RepID=A0A9P5PNU8_9AGAR|nr:hypothetical protein BDP27DRAFT_1421146 [Rhodocollybia butyracea]